MKIIFEGPFFSETSLAIINRNLCRHFQDKCELAILPTDKKGPDSASLDETLRSRIASREKIFSQPDADIHIRHKWPPDFQKPKARRWVQFQPWEFGALPLDWSEHMIKGAHRVWAYSGFLKDCFIKNGVPPEKIDIVSPGIDPDHYCPEAPKNKKLAADSRFKFLFVGGTIFRKGIDILLGAYAKNFLMRNDVVLVIKDYAVNAVYNNLSFRDMITKMQSLQGVPEIQYLSGDLSEEEMAGLYTACDVLVSPYRAEGFGMPLLESLACGTPVIATGYGSCLDFCISGPCCLLSSTLKHDIECEINGMKTPFPAFYAEPDEKDLVSAMEKVMNESPSLKEKAKEYSCVLRKSYRWENISRTAFEILEDMLK